MKDRKEVTRRRFLGSVVAASTGAIVLPHLPAVGSEKPEKKLTATDQVPLGKSNITVCRLGMGTGSRNGRVQRELGQEKFTRLVRHALDRGITFFDTADQYDGLHEMLREALKGVDREKIQIQSKINHSRHDDPLREINRLRRELGTEYLDSLLIHCVRTLDWPETQKKLMDILSQAKEKGIIRSRGISMHGLLPLRGAAATSWGDTRQVRINHNGRHMDALGKRKANVTDVIDCVKKMHAAGKGIVGMKLIGNGDFTRAATRKSSLDFVLSLECVDAVVIGFKSPQEVDEAMERINTALARRA